LFTTVPKAIRHEECLEGRTRQDISVKKKGQGTMEENEGRPSEAAPIVVVLDHAAMQPTVFPSLRHFLAD
jgi:hypothetical protein